MREIKTLKPFISSGCWSYVVNENGSALRMTFEGYGSCTPAPVIQEMINGLTREQFESLWNECENKKDTLD